MKNKVQILMYADDTGAQIEVNAFPAMPDSSQGNDVSHSIGNGA